MKLAIKSANRYVVPLETCVGWIMTEALGLGTSCAQATSSNSLFICRPQHGRPTYLCCSCYRSCYGIRLTQSDFLPEDSGTEHKPAQTLSEETIVNGCDDKEVSGRAQLESDAAQEHAVMGE